MDRKLINNNNDDDSNKFITNGTLAKVGDRKISSEKFRGNGSFAL